MKKVTESRRKASIDMQNKKIYFIGSGLTLILYLVLPLMVNYVLKNAEGTIEIAILIHFVVGPIDSFIAYGSVSYIWFISIVSLFLGYTIGYYVYENI